MIPQFNVKTAFLNAPLNETIYTYQPHGFNDGITRVCLVNNCLLRGKYT